MISRACGNPAYSPTLLSPSRKMISFHSDSNLLIKIYKVCHGLRSGCSIEYNSVLSPCIASSLC